MKICEGFRSLKILMAKSKSQKLCADWEQMQIYSVCFEERGREREREIVSHFIQVRKSKLQFFVVIHWLNAIRVMRLSMKNVR
jgi:hypothetical protein